MREALVVLAIILITLGLTAIKYRRQIKGMIEMWRALGEIRRGTIGNRRNAPEEIKSGGKLVNCAKCGRWIPETAGVKLGKSTVVCASECATKM